MRAAGIQHSRGASFNNTLKDMQGQFKDSSQHQNFWQLLMDLQISLVTVEEDPETGVSAAEAEGFLKQHASTGEVNLPNLPMLCHRESPRVSKQSSDKAEL